MIVFFSIYLVLFIFWFFFLCLFPVCGSLCFVCLSIHFLFHSPVSCMSCSFPFLVTPDWLPLCFPLHPAACIVSVVPVVFVRVLFSSLVFVPWRWLSLVSVECVSGWISFCLPPASSLRPHLGRPSLIKHNNMV